MKKTLSEFLKLPEKIQEEAILFSRTGVKELDDFQEVIMVMNNNLEPFERMKFQRLLNMMQIRPF